MPHWVPSWQLAVTVAGSVGLVSVIARTWLRIAKARGGPDRPKTAIAALAGWEIAIIIGLYGFWQLAGSLSTVDLSKGVQRGQHLWNLERDLHLPSEKSVQSFFLPHEWFIKFLDLYYVIAHYNVLLIMLAWLFWRHRDRYREARTIGLTTFACLAVQLIPVAPPRLIPGHGIVDTAILYGQSVYGPVGQGFSDQYSAMPSVHIAWSSAVAFFVWRSTKSRWRILGPAHALLTWVVVLVTGNHYWLDGFVAITLLALSFWTVRLVTLLVTRVSEWVSWTPAGSWLRTRTARAGLASHSLGSASSYSPDVVEVAESSSPARAQPPPPESQPATASSSPPSR
jgi:PAP2 superfamily